MQRCISKPATGWPAVTKSKQSADNLEFMDESGDLPRASPWPSPFFPSVSLDDASSSRHTTNKTGELAEAAAGVRGISIPGVPGTCIAVFGERA